ncbi:MAG TPA: hypothetical protein VKP30_10435, partial [Polyangiaceae bacterium]|nr:hypothetical protein [Polyangiaceae bacterium]
RNNSDDWDQREQYAEGPSTAARPYANKLHAKVVDGHTDTIIDRSAFSDLEYGGTPPRFRAGQIVEHARFGRGRVERVESGGDTLAVVAKFPGFGSRKILAKFLSATTS